MLICDDGIGGAGDGGIIDQNNGDNGDTSDDDCGASDGYDGCVAGMVISDSGDEFR